MLTLPEKRRAYVPKVPAILRNLGEVVCKEEGRQRKVSPPIAAGFPHLQARSVFALMKGKPSQTGPLKVGVVFSGGPAPGGHNVLAGLFDALSQIHKDSKLIGFLGGFSGLVKNRSKELQKEEIDSVRNQGGFDCIGTGRTKLETADDLLQVKKTLDSFDALVVIGGDDSNTNGVILAEYLLGQGSPTAIIGVPKTIDGDLQSEEIELSFGFDSACKTYAELIGNICRDALSTRKYYHFIKLMGRSASHIALECALLTQPNLTIIGEERKSLHQIVNEIADLIVARKKMGKEFGVLLIPEGVIEFMPEIGALIQALNRKGEALPAKEKKTFDSLPAKIGAQLLEERDPHGNIKVSQIDTEALLMQLVKQELEARHFSGEIHFQEHFFGYEGRSCLPTNFDANYAYALGLLSGVAARDHLTGVICAIASLNKMPEYWTPLLAPLVPMLHLEERSAAMKPVITKVLVDIKGSHYLYYLLHKPKWALEDAYRFPGPIQFFGDGELTDSCPRILSQL